ncbi:hypothetical protein FHP25_03295 [Vineibacter terrae]|uniref:Sarcosine oxidase subunit gamma n=1 Tax=Vineibacter terrae TaxID=2586908 RepID=A0A5C8PTG8_9HYPH|nr:hypothetical protein [Vineibacter terrae]TXL81566.1 hypothetical protein FHP25_03295 [Vineibacter terrae]
MPESPVAGVRLQTVEGIALTVLRGRGDDAAFIAGAARWLGQDLPDSYNEMSRRGDASICRLGPDEWLVIGVRPEGDPPSPVIAVDVSSARSVLRLDGPGAADLLATGCALDLDGGALSRGRFAQARLGAFAVLLLAPRDRDGAIDILVARSYARSLTAWLTPGSSP